MISHRPHKRREQPALNVSRRWLLVGDPIKHSLGYEGNKIRAPVETRFCTANRALFSSPGTRSLNKNMKVVCFGRISAFPNAWPPTFRNMPFHPFLATTSDPTTRTEKSHDLRTMMKETRLGCSADYPCHLARRMPGINVAMTADFGCNGLPPGLPQVRFAVSHFHIRPRLRVGIN